jgi:hypothetical protein
MLGGSVVVGLRMDDTGSGYGKFLRMYGINSRGQPTVGGPHLILWSGLWPLIAP